MPNSGPFSIIVTEQDVGKRLDAVVAKYIEDCSRSTAAKLIKDGQVLVNDDLKKPSYHVLFGDVISGALPEPVDISITPENIPIDIIFEDRHIVVINKQPGMVVHPAPGNYTGTLVNALMYHCRDFKGIAGQIRPGIVHRLDKDTSGTLVVAKTDQAHAHLSHQFKSRQVDKTYVALVHGVLKTDMGKVDLPIGRHPIDRKKMSVISKHGRASETIWRIKQQYENIALVEVTIKTGRTHQIRVHFAALGHPVVGDKVYGSTRKKDPAMMADRQMLHAWKLALTHPVSNERMTFESPIPEDMNRLIGVLDK